MASLIEQKGLPDLIAVAARFRQRRDDLCFVVVGEGHMRAELERLRCEHDLDDMLVFTGWVPNAVEAALPAFDVFFQPSLWEAMSIALLEAMAAAKPIVATRVGEAPFVLEDGVNALLVNANDIDGMTLALTRVIDDGNLRRVFGCAARRTVNEHFTVAAMTREYEEIYLTACGLM
jgi:glycosyltransferase involved in cell wall biosynthesis